MKKNQDKSNDKQNISQKYEKYGNIKTTSEPELQIIFTVVSVFTKENFNPFSNLISPFSIGTHEIQWLFSIFLVSHIFIIINL